MSEDRHLPAPSPMRRTKYARIDNRRFFFAGALSSSLTVVFQLGTMGRPFAQVGRVLEVVPGKGLVLEMGWKGEAVQRGVGLSWCALTAATAGVSISKKI